jgi:hypothetical protein
MKSSRVTKGWTARAVVLAALAAGPACRRAESLPEVPGAQHVVPASAIRLFREVPVSTREFDDAARRWTASTSPRFDEGRLRMGPGADGGMIVIEAPPPMAFRNRGDDCGPAAERRVCRLQWDRASIALCGRPLSGHINITSDRLDQAAFLVCRVITPAHEAEDGGWAYAERDCTRSELIPLRSLHPQDLSFRVGDTAVVADPGGAYDRTVCERLERMWRGPGGSSTSRGGGADGGGT